MGKYIRGYSLTTEHSNMVQMNKLELHLAMQINLTNVMLNERS